MGYAEVKRRLSFIAGLIFALASRQTFAECDNVRGRATDVIKIEFCKSDAVFVGKVEQIIETIGGLTNADGSQKHFRTQHTTVKVLESFKGNVKDKVTLITDLYAKTDRAFEFESDKTYVIFAKRLTDQDEYAAAGACAAQPTLRIEQAKEILAQLKQTRTRVGCKRL